MKSLTIRLPNALASEIEHESRARRISKSDVVRERLGHPTPGQASRGSMLELAGDLIGSVSGLPPDLSVGKRRYLAERIRAKKLHR